jgi:hypothetical protein
LCLLCPVYLPHEGELEHYLPSVMDEGHTVSLTAAPADWATLTNND